jgi:hypothetical protein
MIFVAIIKLLTTKQLLKKDQAKLNEYNFNNKIISISKNIFI